MNCKCVFTVDLVSSSQGVEQSSVHQDHLATQAVDNSDDTCAVTKLEEQTWWQSVMNTPNIVHTVVLKTGLAFGCEYMATNNL